MNMIFFFTGILLHILVQTVPSNASCVMRGICNSDKKLYCEYHGPAQEISSKYLSEICLQEDKLACCDNTQLDILHDNLQLLGFLVKDSTDDPTCYNGLVGMLCDLTCGQNQDAYTRVTNSTVVGDQKHVNTVSFNMSRIEAQQIYDACAKIEILFLGQAIASICHVENCGMEKFFASMGNSEGDNGRSPFQINFRFTELELKRSDNLEMTTNIPSPVDYQPSPTLANEIVREDQANAEDSTLLVHLMVDKPLWLAMVLCFLCFTLLFLTGIAIQWCFNRSRDDVVSGAGSYSPPIGCYFKVGATIQFGMTRLFARQGALVAKFPLTTLFITVSLLAVMCCGFIRFRVVTDPVELWSDPTSRARLEKKYFDQHFGPFYRTEQLIIRPKNATPFVRDGATFGSIFHKEFLQAVLDLQGIVTSIKASSKISKDPIGLSDICYKPLMPQSNECGVFSALEYFQSNASLLNLVKNDHDYFDQLQYCSKKIVADDGPLSGCRGKSGMPMFANLVFGGFEDDDYMQSSATVMTILVKNSIDPTSVQIKMAKAWETVFIYTVLQWKKQHPDISVAFVAERSVEDEISRQSHSDISTVLISYVIMFVYVSICLGNYRSWRTFLIDLKISLSVGGVLIVLASVLASIGLWSYAGVPATLIIVEVIPFLVLAVGVDNIFIMVQDFSLHNDVEEEEEDEDLTGSIRSFAAGDFYKPPSATGGKKVSVESRISQTLGRVGPSIFLSSAAESVAFFCGAMTTMPAVRVFALYAGVSICINFLLQIFAFTALLTLDAKRTKANRLDVFCCIQMILPQHTDDDGVSADDDNDSLTAGRGKVEAEKPSDIEDEYEPVGNVSIRGDEIASVSRRITKKRQRLHKKNDHPWLYRFVAHCLAPTILSKWVRPILLIIYVGWICFCIAIIPNGVKIGLDQKLSMSLDSYVLEYFEEMSQFLAVGPPVYFVVTNGHNFDSLHGQNQVCGRPSCYHNSLLRTLKRNIDSKRSRLSQPLLSWMDDYTLWSGYKKCCGVMDASKNLQFCDPSNVTNACSTCPRVNDRISGEMFNQLLPNFLNRIPDETCPYGGKAQYGSAIVLSSENQKESQATNRMPLHVVTSHFAAHHTVLKTVDNYIDAIRKARELADRFGPQWMSEENTASPSLLSGPQPNTVFPYSVFYVYYEQYLSIVNETIIQVTLGLFAVSVITWIMLGLDIVATLNVILGVFSIVLSVTAMMALWDISLNAISLVNLVVCIGISVEFCAHIVRAFTISTKANRILRALDALSEMGSSVLRGITLTKFGGILVLAFAKSRLFQIFYFRMYLCMVLFGAAVGIIFLPVQLSYFGPSLNRALLYKQKRKTSTHSRKGSGKSQRRS